MDANLTVITASEHRQPDWSASTSGTNEVTTLSPPVLSILNGGSSPAGALSNSPTVDGPSSEDVRTLVFVADGILTFIVALTGVLANLANVVVLVRIIKSRHGSSSIYHVLVALAAADLGVMGVSLLYAVRFNLRQRPPVTADDVGHPPQIDVASYFFYNTWFLFANVCCVMSNWCVVVTSLFRLIAIFFPFSARRLTSVGRARAAIAATFVIAVAVNAPDMSASVYANGRFEMQPHWSPHFYLPLIFVMYVVPWLLSSVVVALILAGLRAYRLQPSSAPRKDARQAEQRRLTHALVTVAVAFVVTTAPTVVYFLMTVANAGSPNYERQPHMLRFHASSRLVVLLNYTSNFFVYATMSGRYRDVFFATVLRRSAPPGSQPFRLTPVALRSLRDVGLPGAVASDAVRTLAAIQSRP